MRGPTTTADAPTEVIANGEETTWPFSSGWQNSYVGWRAAHGDELGAVTAAVPNDGVLELIYELLESAVQTGWEAGAGDARE